LTEKNNKKRLNDLLDDVIKEQEELLKGRSSTTDMTFTALMELWLGVLIGALYGLRREEIVGLRWRAINFEANTLSVEHVVVDTRVDGKRIVLEKERTKNDASRRTLPLMPILRAKLLLLKTEQERNRKLCGRSYSKKHLDYIYVDELGVRVKPGYLTTAFPAFLVKNNFKRIRFHDLRHSCASLLLANGVTLKEIQEWLGHSTFKTTADTYAHLDFELFPLLGTLCPSVDYSILQKPLKVK
jgi:integrase